MEFAGDARDRCENRFKRAAENFWVEGTEWSWEDELVALNEDLSNITERVRQDAIMDIVSEIEVSITMTPWKLIHINWSNREHWTVKSRLL